MNPITLSILLTLLEKRKVSRTFLAEKYEVSPRTISRYIDTLLSGGVPVLSLTGHNGGYMLPDDYKIDNMFFNKAELNRMCECLDLTKNNFNDGMNLSINQKLMSLGTKKTSTEQLCGTYKNLVIDAGAWGESGKFSAKIDVINSSIDSRRSLTIKYVDKHDFYSERMVDPYSLVLKQNVWYLYAFCHKRNDFRLFKLSRISYIVVTDKLFTMRTDADVSKKLGEQFLDSFEEVDLVIEFSSLILSQIEEWLGSDAIYEEELSYRAAATVFGGVDLISKILSFGSSVKVISPASLKEAVIKECKLVIES